MRIIVGMVLLFLMTACGSDDNGTRTDSPFATSRTSVHPPLDDEGSPAEADWRGHP